MLPGAWAQASPPPAVPVLFQALASWYGSDFQGKPTANGETYDKDALTAAHPSLPFGTLLLVSNPDNGASVVVRINDRGPFVAGRDLDLSEAAAVILGLRVTGTGRVNCRVLSPEEFAGYGSPSRAPSTQGQAGAAGGSVLPPAGSASSCRIQVASFKDVKNAQATRERLRLSGLEAVLETAGAYTRVVFPAVPSAEAEALAERLRGLGYIDLQIVWTK